MLFDLPLDELERYKPPRQEPEDFDAFWENSLAEARAWALEPHFTPVEVGLKTVACFDVTFSGYGGQRVKGWFLRPQGIDSPEPLPGMVEFIGYGGGRGRPTDWLLWPSAGFAYLVMDTRGQGSTWREGHTPDLPTEGANAHFPGFLTQGILDPKTYYYRRLFVDAVRAVETLKSREEVDPARVAVTGGSQGGGVSLAVAGLVPDLAAVMPDVPFLCHYRRATHMTDAMPYNEIARYCKIHRGEVESVFRTLSYFDGVNFAARADARALFSAALMDTVCPPSTVFAAYNHYAGEKDIRVYPYNGHEGGEGVQTAAKLAYVEALQGG